MEFAKLFVATSKQIQCTSMVVVIHKYGTYNARRVVLELSVEIPYPVP